MATKCYCGRGTNCDCGKSRRDSLPPYSSLFPSAPSDVPQGPSLVPPSGVSYPPAPAPGIPPPGVSSGVSYPTVHVAPTPGMTPAGNSSVISHPPVHMAPSPAGYYQPPSGPYAYPPPAQQINYTSNPSTYPASGNIAPNSTVHPNTVFYPAMTVNSDPRFRKNTVCGTIICVIFMIIFFSVAGFIIHKIIQHESESPF